MVSGEGTIEVAPLLAGCYAVTARVGEGAGRGTEWVSGSGKDRKRWAAARRRFERDRADADAVLDAPVERPWWRRGRRLARVRWLPGYRAEQRARAAQRAERAALLGRAEQRYRPVHEEILTRVTVVREERERAARVARERQERPADVARRQVWGWVWKGRSVAVVFRHDVEEAHSLLADAGVRARGPLTLYQVGDELYEYGMTTVRWDDATKRAVVADCAEAGHWLTFTEWWAAVGPWEQPHRGPTAWCTNRPRWPVPTYRSRERLREQLERGTSHHSSYGVGDSGFGGF
ncbi:hypothetical protein AB0I98_19140 [Streptomyces sp. NPDC050211]|uniref:hypothetical protein n=1 Tax=Streptomyces sp. NPDC050211 TaxID=3154932 RepID=UPI00342F947C